MSSPPDEYYTDERWNNWVDRLREEEIDPESDDSARLFFNLLDDATIAIAKVVTDYEDGEIDADAAAEELGRIREIVLSEVEIDEEEKLTLVDGIQTSLVCAFYTAEEYIVGGPADEGTVEEHLRAAAAAETDEEDLDTALAHCVQAGTLIVEGAELGMDVAEEIEYGLVADWVNGLDSLGRALADPEVVEEDE
ncbi:DUF2150 family protein [Natronomonas moolapensis 8.8.11]|uniref:DUF2150 family protein n=1 Tax=Natronomonas moolapensis (strain DSM 18674 / CECT 7526 / JCM 14361 / 8.8.11) TaxID=268739 RepID=M1XP77_NATM8|nr:DUF2150 family protein [Natronomonas moolapensis]CCQ35811.1 DUF2150 family protein [Natronomonas moolapensis 8.8.11]